MYFLTVGMAFQQRNKKRGRNDQKVDIAERRGFMADIIDRHSPYAFARDILSVQFWTVTRRAFSINYN